MKTAHASVPSRESVSLDAATAQKLFVTFLGVGIVGLGASATGWMSEASRPQFFHSYLVAFMFCLSLTLGSLFFTAIQHLVGAQWSVGVRRLAELVTPNFVVLVVLLIPVLLGMHDLYHWTHAEAVATDKLLMGKKAYLNQGFFMARMVLYFVVWIGASMMFFRGSVSTDTTGDASAIRRLRAISAPTVLLFAMTQTFASFDLLMSLDPHWFSTIFGVYFFAGSVVSTFSMLALIALWLRSSGKLKDVLTVHHFHDLGKLMFAFTVFWTYIAFSQYFLIWYGNIPEETIFYLHRWEGSWKGVSLLLLFGHFVVPFAILMSRHVKRNLTMLTVMAIWMLFMQFVDLHWLVLPNLHKTGFSFHWLDITCMLGVVGVWAAFVARRMGQHSLVPVGDPLLVKSMEFENV